MSLITPTQLKQLIKDKPDLVIIDIRTEKEMGEGRVPNARWMDVSDINFMSKAKDLSKDKNYCLYCASGERSEMAVSFMEMNGFLNIYDLKGGIASWINEGNILEQAQL